MSKKLKTKVKSVRVNTIAPDTFARVLGYVFGAGWAVRRRELEAGLRSWIKSHPGMTFRGMPVVADSRLSHGEVYLVPFRCPQCGSSVMGPWRFREEHETRKKYMRACPCGGLHDIVRIHCRAGVPDDELRWLVEFEVSNANERGLERGYQPSTLVWP